MNRIQHILNRCSFNAIAVFILFLCSSISAAPSVNLLFPQNGQGSIDLTPTFTWHSEGTGTLTQTLYVDTDLNPFEGGTLYSVGEDTTVTLTEDLVPGRNYYWGVEVTTGAETTRSIVRSFTIMDTGKGGITHKDITISLENYEAGVVESADMDGDGDMDVVSTTINYGKIYWHENVDGENFIEHVIEPLGYNGKSLAPIDIDGDGDMDVLSARTTSNKIIVYINDGNQEFSEHLISNTVGVWSVVPTDIDGDGDIDIVSGSKDMVAVYENKGSGNFEEHVVNKTSTQIVKVLIADIDNDSDIDILAVYESQKFIPIYINEGSFKFTSRAVVIDAFRVKTMELGDVDSDNDIDLIVSYFDPYKELGWYENNGAASFDEHFIPTQFEDFNAVTAYDNDGDGDMDIAVADFWGKSIVLFENNGNEVFVEKVVSDSIVGIQDLAVADMNNDGDLDLISASWKGRKVLVHDNMGTVDVNTVSMTEMRSTSALASGYITETDDDQPITAHGFCWNTEGLPKLDDNKNDYEAVSGPTAFTYSIQNLLPQATYFIRAYALKAGVVIYGNELSFFTPSPRINLISPINNQSLIDLTPQFTWQSEGTGSVNHVLYIDTDLDPFDGGIVRDVGTEQSYTLDVTLETGTQYYWAVAVTDDNGTVKSMVKRFSTLVTGKGGDHFNEYVITDSENTNGLDIADIDSDGQLDIIFVTVNNNKIFWYKDRGGALVKNEIPTQNGNKLVKAVDIENDGDLDFIVVSEHDDLFLYENRGNGTFDGSSMDITLDGAASLFVVDMDGDGDGDIIAGYEGDYSICWIENRGLGNFKKHGIASASNGRPTMVVSDLDLDGDADIIAALRTKNVWYDNDGAGNFTERIIAERWIQQSRMFVHDMDRDGDMDAVVRSGINSLAMLEKDGNTFTSNSIVNDTEQNQLLGLVDINSDGYTDVIASLNRSSVIGYKNLGGGNFELYDMLGLPYKTGTALSADLDNDGDMDIVFGGSKISWYENVGSLEVSTQTISDILTHTATAIGSIDVLATTEQVEAHGFCWAVSSEPTLTDSYSDEGAASGTGEFNSNITGLAVHTTYYIRAYVTNAQQETIYGNEITFSTLNTPPTITRVDSKEIDEDTSIELLLEYTDASDDDGDDLTLIVEDGKDYTTVGTTITPLLNVNGELTVSLRVTDGIDTSEQVFMTVTVTPVNDAPEITDVGTPRVLEDEELVIDFTMLTATDVDNDQGDLSIRVLDGDYYSVSGDATIIPEKNHVGDLTVEVTVFDGDVSSDPAPMTVTVTPVNDAPVITGTIPQSIDEGTPLTMSLSMLKVSDIDNTLTNDNVIIESGDDYTILDSEITPVAGFVGDLSVSVRVTDGKATTQPVIVIVTVLAKEVSSSSMLSSSSSMPLSSSRTASSSQGVSSSVMSSAQVYSSSQTLSSSRTVSSPQRVSSSVMSSAQVYNSSHALGNGVSSSRGVITGEPQMSSVLVGPGISSVIDTLALASSSVGGESSAVGTPIFFDGDGHIGGVVVVVTNITGQNLTIRAPEERGFYTIYTVLGYQLFTGTIHKGFVEIPHNAPKGMLVIRFE